MDTNLVTWRKASYSAQNSTCVEVGVWRKASYSAQNSNCVEVGSWRKASHSAQNSACVEVGVANHSSADVVCLVRDTKDRTGPSLAFPSAAWSTFTTAVKSGRFVLPA
jgi:Domain of unknown function (DUF397)